MPVIIGSVLLGPKKGAFFGFLFGLTWPGEEHHGPQPAELCLLPPFVPLPGTASGSPWALVICFAPRILVGIVPYFAAAGVQKLFGSSSLSRTISYALAGAFGAVINTGLVMGLMGTVLSGAFAAAQGISHDLVSGAILGIVLANGVPETIAAVALTTAICLAVT